jgi:hypothetical protein
MRLFIFYMIIYWWNVSGFITFHLVRALKLLLNMEEIVKSDIEKLQIVDCTDKHLRPPFCHKCATAVGLKQEEEHMIGGLHCFSEGLDFAFFNRRFRLAWASEMKKNERVKAVEKERRKKFANQRKMNRVALAFNIRLLCIFILCWLSLFCPVCGLG